MGRKARALGAPNAREAGGHEMGKARQREVICEACSLLEVEDPEARQEKGKWETR